MRTLLVGVALLALAAPAAHAQQADEPAAAVSGQAEPGRFLVYFGFDKAWTRARAGWSPRRPTSTSARARRRLPSPATPIRRAGRPTTSASPSGGPRQCGTSSSGWA